MSPERENNQISLEEVISNAAEIMLQNGEHRPTLIMETNNNLMVGHIPDMPATHGERVELMRFLGQVAAKSGRVDQLQQVFMVSEGWMSAANGDQPAKFRPSEDPDRMEVLIVSGIQMKERKKYLKILEILRESNQQVIGLKELSPAEKIDEKVEIPLLDAFVQGFHLAFQTKFN